LLLKLKPPKKTLPKFSNKLTNFKSRTLLLQPLRPKLKNLTPNPVMKMMINPLHRRPNQQFLLNKPSNKNNKSVKLCKRQSKRVRMKSLNFRSNFN
jgi:hypothetical protein